MDKSKFLHVKYLSGSRQAAFAVNDPRFLRLNELSDEIYETEFYRRSIRMDLPVQIGFAILQYAKLFLLKFYYSFLIKSVGFQNFEHLETDTDSSYIALASETLEGSILPEMKAEFQSSLLDHCNDNYVLTEDSWFARTCCKKHNQFDSRTPGIMKEEWRGNKMICLCSKSYVAVCQQEGTIKFSLKGVNKRNFVDPTCTFEKVLRTQETQMSINRGIRLRGNTLFTYEQSKKAFTYFYCKRRVLNDGIHTRCLDLTLKPKKRKRNDTEFVGDDI